MKHFSPHVLILSLGILGTLPVAASPAITVEVAGLARPPASLVRLATGAPSTATDPLDFPEAAGPISVGFPNVTAGDYIGQISFGDDTWSDVLVDSVTFFGFSTIINEGGTAGAFGFESPYWVAPLVCKIIAAGFLWDSGLEALPGGAMRARMAGT